MRFTLPKQTKAHQFNTDEPPISSLDHHIKQCTQVARIKKLINKLVGSFPQLPFEEEINPNIQNDPKFLGQDSAIVIYYGLLPCHEL